mmetsp:Transcript_25620/g.75626  ORF Transcript_25620/g.75626 Transcript_25620/m.75626 type:complete len:125 (+) Transcript_25620:2268-2642(+)
MGGALQGTPGVQGSTRALPRAQVASRIGTMGETATIPIFIPKEGRAVQAFPRKSYSAHRCGICLGRLLKARGGLVSKEKINLSFYSSPDLSLGDCSSAKHLDFINENCTDCVACNGEPLAPFAS